MNSTDVHVRAGSGMRTSKEGYEVLWRWFVGYWRFNNMVTINGAVSLIGTIICIGILFTPIIIIAILGTRARFIEAKQIRQNLANGVYNKWDKAKSNRLRIMIVSQMALMLSFFVWIATGLLDTINMFSFFRLVILALIFLVMFILGFAINHMMVKGE